MWTPYRHLIYYVGARKRERLDPSQRTSVKTLRKRSMGQIEELLDASVPPEFRVEQPEWPPPRPNADWEIERFSGRLRRFLNRGSHESRKIIDQLLLAYYQRGFGLKGAVERTQADYSTIGEDVLPLGVMDLLSYAAFFWNFDAPQEETERYADNHLAGVRRAVYDGNRTLRDVRLSAGVVRGFDAGKELRRMASVNTKLAQELSKELLSGEDIDVEESRKYKDIASFQNTTVAVVRAAREIGTGEQEGLRLKQFFDDVWQDVDKDIDDYEELEDRHTSPEELQAENQEVEDDQVEASLPAKEGADNSDERGY